ncbi:epidermal growth factor-like protein 8 [Schistocerca piceifrons]|uniref:epidermal growth factor-like protein 8 n=1 Tax=Schistocerca piceifrons TaxID=274613 RepID=UPI001F5E6326|nr:epidermal growth factor-like protein 8 [Schistocerca piceifrons]
MKRLFQLHDILVIRHSIDSTGIPDLCLCRHVCSVQKAVPQQVKHVESFSKPTQISYQHKCDNGSGLCKAVRTVYQKAFRTVYSTRYSKHSSFACCPGWTQVKPTSYGCMQAVCVTPCLNSGTCVKPERCSCPPGFTGHHCEHSVCSPSCLNGGSCVKPNLCTCPPGFTGHRCETRDCGGCRNGGTCLRTGLCACRDGYGGDHCEHDVDECSSNPCDQLCTNSVGSFQCECRPGFTLLADGKSCRSQGNITATEARDLMDFEFISERLEERVTAIEKKMALQEIQTEHISYVSLSEMNNKMVSIMESVTELQNQLESIKLVQSEAGRLMRTLQNYRTEIERINPLCSQVSSLQHRIQTCNCRSAYGYKYHLT